MERDALVNAVRQIAWGYLLLHVNLNLGTLNLLPDWLGYLLILKALPILGERAPSALLLRPLGILLALWAGLLWGLALLGVPFDSTLPSILAAVLSLYFHFQLLTNLAELARGFGCPEQRRILRLRTVRTLLVTVFALLDTAVVLPAAWGQYAGLVVGMAIVNLIVALWICSVLFSLRRSLEAEPARPWAG